MFLKKNNIKNIVVFFHPNFSDGGVERTNIGLARGLTQKGYKVIFLTTSFTEHFLKEIELSNIELVSLGNKKVSMTIAGLIKYLNSLSKNNFIYFISCQYYVNVISMATSLFVKNRNNIKFINSERNHLDEFLVNSGFKNRLMTYFVKFFYKYADLIIANSKETADDLSKYLSRDVGYAYNPTINARINDLEGELVTEGWYLKDDRKCVVGVGRLSEQKDFKTLIKAFHIFNQDKQFKLLILGDGELKSDLKYLIKSLNIQDDVYLPGFVSNPYKFLKISSLFVLSSRYEGLPNALIEAIYLGVLSISTRCKSGPKEILQNDNLLVKVGDYEKMAKKMKYILNNQEEFYKTDFGLERFKFENSIENFLGVIEK